MNKGLRNEILTLLGIGILGSLALRRPKTMVGLGLLATGVALTKTPRASFRRASVVITGGSRGLGLALARELVKEDASVTLLARDLQELERAREILLFEHPGARVQVLACDITQEIQLTTALEEALAMWGSIDMLINNAGAILVGPFDTLKREDFEAQLNLHFYAVLKSCQWAIPHFRRRRRGRIVNICSLGGQSRGSAHAAI
jgi:NAD(P)-dependent dehydrogenase (short-subunit alcohol dehydrogenase family)